MEEIDVVIFGIVINLVLSILIGVIASRKGRSSFGFFLMSFFLTPILALIILLVIGDAKPSLDNLDHIYWCSSCDSTYSGLNNNNTTCPSCHNKLSETTVLAVDWRKQSPDGKTVLRNAFAKGEYLRNDASISEPATIGNISYTTVKEPNKEGSDTANNTSIAGEIAKCKELLDSGAITQEEYESMKNRILNK